MGYCYFSSSLTKIVIFDRFAVDWAKSNTSGETQKILSNRLWRCEYLIETFVSIQPLFFVKKIPKHQPPHAPLPTKKLIKNATIQPTILQKKIQISPSWCAIFHMCIAIFPAIFLPFIDKNCNWAPKWLLCAKTNMWNGTCCRQSEKCTWWPCFDGCIDCLPITAI